jgi:hypothetical protein
MNLTRRGVLRLASRSGLGALAGLALATCPEAAAYAAQSDWRWCHLCEGLWFNGHPTKGVCPGNGGGGHHSDGSGDYRLRFTSDPGTGQSDWRWCHLCEGLWFNGHPTKGVCPGNGGGGHHSDGSGDYQLRQA